MSIFAGVVTATGARADRNVSKAMLSHVIAPYHDQIEHNNDSHSDIATMSQSEESGFFSNDYVTVAADCRLDSIGDLREQLGIERTELNSGAIIASAFLKWGERLVDELSGDFAFAIWCKKSKSLICARDRFGRIPLSYMITRDGIAFASDFLCIAVEHQSLVSINESWIVEYLNNAVVDEHSTPFSEVLRLPPASILKWSDNEHTVRKYWSFAEIGAAKDDLLDGELLEAVECSIRKRMSGMPTATMLSGGLDSSSIALIARDIHHETEQAPMRSVSIVFDDFPDQSERPYIQAVLDEQGFEPHFVNVRDFDVLSAIEQLIRVQGAPTIARGAPVAYHAICEAKRLGVSTVLDGHGGDEIISSFGIMRLFELADKGKWGTLLYELSRTSRNSELNFVGNYIGLFASRANGPTARIIKRMYERFRAKDTTRLQPDLLRADWVSHPSVALSQSVISRTNPARFKSERDFQQNILEAPIQSHALEVLHRQYRSKGLRPEFPFWDADVVELCLRTPSDQKLKNGVPRSLIKSMMGPALPMVISERKSKFDFSDSLVRSLQARSNHLQQIAASANHRVFDYVDHGAFSSAITDLQDSRRSVQVEGFKKVWNVLNLRSWLDVDGSLWPAKEGNTELTC